MLKLLRMLKNYLTIARYTKLQYQKKDGITLLILSEWKDCTKLIKKVDGLIVRALKNLSVI